MQLGDFVTADFHFLPQHPVLLGQHVHHLMGVRHDGEGLALQVRATVWELDTLDRHLGLGGWRSLELLRLGLLILVMLLLLLLLVVVVVVGVHPWGRAIGVVAIAVTSGQVNWS